MDTQSDLSTSLDLVVATRISPLSALAEEQRVTAAFRRLAVHVSWGEANRLFDAAGLNDDRTYVGKGTRANELADHYIALVLDGERETA